MQRWTIHRKLRREQKLCIHHGCAQVSGDKVRCPAHQAVHAEYMRQWRRVQAERRRLLAVAS